MEGTPDTPWRVGAPRLHPLTEVALHSKHRHDGTWCSGIALDCQAIIPYRMKALQATPS